MTQQIKLLINEIKDTYGQENFKRIESFFNRVRVRDNPTYTDTNRPTSQLKDGDTIFNTDDGQLNIWYNDEWTLPDGSPT